MRKVKELFLIVITSLTLAIGLGAVGFTALASADASTDAAKKASCEAIDGKYSGSTCTTAGPSLNNVLGSVINILSMVVGLAAVIMVIVGGFKYVTSGGDSSKASNARSTITYAVIGIVIAAIAQALVQFVLKKST